MKKKYKQKKKKKKIQVLRIIELSFFDSWRLAGQETTPPPNLIDVIWEKDCSSMALITYLKI